MYKQGARSREHYLKHPIISPMLSKSTVLLLLALACNMRVQYHCKVIGVFVNCSEMLK